VKALLHDGSVLRVTSATSGAQGTLFHAGCGALRCVAAPRVTAAHTATHPVWTNLNVCTAVCLFVYGQIFNKFEGTWITETLTELWKVIGYGKCTSAARR